MSAFTPARDVSFDVRNVHVPGGPRQSGRYVDIVLAGSQNKVKADLLYDASTSQLRHLGTTAVA